MTEQRRCVWKDEVGCYRDGRECQFPNHPELCRHYDPYPRDYSQQTKPYNEATNPAGSWIVYAEGEQTHPADLNGKDKTADTYDKEKLK